MSKTNFKNIAKKVIETEIQSLKKLKNNLDKSFNTAVETILNCKNGKVIISGVGKSGIIAKKISSTLSSVGTPSFFVDANSCSHGDLGQIASNDVLILIPERTSIQESFFFGPMRTFQEFILKISEQDETIKELEEKLKKYESKN